VIRLNADVVPRRHARLLGRLAKTEEQVLDLVENNFTHLDNLVEVAGGSVRLRHRPEWIVFVALSPRRDWLIARGTPN
jgi:hypothetical protein